MDTTLGMGSKSVLIAGAVLVLAAAAAEGADFLLTGTSHLDVTTSYTNGELHNASTADVLAGGYIDSAYVYDVALLRVMRPSGVAIGAAKAYGLGRIALSSGDVSSVATYGASSVEISGGSVSSLGPCDTSTAYISGGSVTYLDAYNTSTVNVSGGNVPSLDAYNSSIVNISGGKVSILDTPDTNTVTVTVSGGIVSSLNTRDAGNVDISGGYVPSLSVQGTSRVNISGGIVSSYLSAHNTSRVDISGGSVSYLHAFDTSGTTLHGYGFWATAGLSLIGDEVIGTGVLAGKWFDGTAWAVSIASHDPGATILAKSAIPGDANLDGLVNLADLTALATNYGASGKAWADGDFDGNGLVNLADLTALATNYGVSSGGSAGVPEPATLALLGLGALALIRRRRVG